MSVDCLESRDICLISLESEFSERQLLTVLGTDVRVALFNGVESPELEEPTPLPLDQ